LGISGQGPGKYDVITWVREGGGRIKEKHVLLEGAYSEWLERKAGQ